MLGVTNIRLKAVAGIDPNRVEASLPFFPPEEHQEIGPSPDPSNPPAVSSLLT